MNFIEAVKLMKEGKKMRLSCFDFEHHFIIDEEGNLMGSNGVKQNFNIAFTDSNDWEVIENKVIPLSEKVGDVKVFPHHEVLMVEDVKEAVNNLIQEIKSNDYNILKPKTIELFKKHFGDLVE